MNSQYISSDILVNSKETVGALKTEILYIVMRLSMTIDWVSINNCIYWTLMQLVTTPHKSLLHTNQCSQSRCSVTAPQLPCSAACVLAGAASLRTPVNCPLSDFNCPQSRCSVTADVPLLPGWRSCRSAATIPRHSRTLTADCRLSTATNCPFKTDCRTVMSPYMPVARTALKTPSPTILLLSRHCPPVRSLPIAPVLLLTGRYLATDDVFWLRGSVFIELLRSDGRLMWLHNYCSEQTCFSIIEFIPVQWLLYVAHDVTSAFYPRIVCAYVFIWFSE
jgi:hypothetical protein